MRRTRMRRRRRRRSSRRTRTTTRRRTRRTGVLPMSFTHPTVMGENFCDKYCSVAQFFLLHELFPPKCGAKILAEITARWRAPSTGSTCSFCAADPDNFHRNDDPE